MVLVHAHPDDETITCGGVMALACAAGDGVTLVTCTGGELGEVIPPALRHLEGDAAGLASTRDDELGAACGALGVIDRRYLGGPGAWHDSGMVATAGSILAAAPSSFSDRAFAHEHGRATQVAQLVEVLREVAPGVVVSYDAGGGYGHPDHVRAHDITVAAVAEVDPDGTAITVLATAAPHDDVAVGLEVLRRRPGLGLPVPDVAGLPTVPDATIDVRVPLGWALRAKLAALRAHATQIDVRDDDAEPPVYALSNGLAQPVLGEECFVHQRGPASPADGLFGAGSVGAGSVGVFGVAR